MADAERAVVYVDSATDLTSLSKTSAPASSTSASANGSGSGGRRILPKLQDKNNYVIKIQIGEETVYNPVRIEVSTGKNCSRGGGLGKSTLMGEESPLNSSGQSSPRSDMTPPPRINTGAIRFGSETSESDTESDVSAEYRPACPTAQFAMREMLEMEPIRSMTMTKSTLNKSLSYISTPTQDIPLRAHFKEIRERDLSPSSTSSSNSRNGLDSNGNNRHHPLKQTLSLCPTSLPGSSGNSGNGLTSSFGSLSNSNDIESISMGPSRLSLLNSRSSRMSRFLEDSSKSKDSSRPVIMDENGFHLNEMSDINGKMMNEKKESLSNFAGYKDIFARAKKDGPSQIMSDKGTIRGVKNRVRDGIATFLQSKDTKTYSEKEQGRVVVYVTSMGVVRDTFQRCQKVKQILRTLMVKFDERDCYMNRSIQSEIRQRLPPRANNQNQNQHSTGTGSSSINTLNQSQSSHLNQIQIQNQATTPSSKHQHQCTNDHIALPQVFLEGQHLGDAEAIEKLNETGELRDLLRPYKSLSVLSTCDRCGGFRVLPCPICNGSKKSVHRNHFTTEFVALKCMHCDPSGLVKCEICNVADA